MGMITIQGASLDTPEWWRSKRNKSKDDLVLDLREAHRGWSNAVSALNSEREAIVALAAERDALRGELSELSGRYAGLRREYGELSMLYHSIPNANQRDRAETAEAERDELRARVAALEEALKDYVEWLRAYCPGLQIEGIACSQCVSTGCLAHPKSQLALKEATPINERERVSGAYTRLDGAP